MFGLELFAHLGDLGMVNPPAPPPGGNTELREDGGSELREDGTLELRE